MSWDIIWLNIETKCKLGEGQDSASQMAHTSPMLMHYDNISICHAVLIAGFTLTQNVSISVFAVGVKTPFDIVESLVFALNASSYPSSTEYTEAKRTSCYVL